MKESISGIVNDLKSRQKTAGMFSWLLPIVAIIIGVVLFLLYNAEGQGGDKLWLLLAFICVAIFYYFFYTYVKGYYGKRIDELNKA